MPNKMKSNNPPRRVDIRGQDHLLAYITPDEAQLLMNNGGAGKPGPMGIPAFYGGPDAGRSQGGFGGRGRDYDGRSEDRDAAQAARDRAADRAREAAQERERQAAGEAARQRIAAANAKLAQETAAKRAAEKAAGLKQAFDETDYGAATKAQLDRAVSQALGNIGGTRKMAGLTREQFKAMPSYMKAMLDPTSPFFTGAYNYDFDDTGKVTGFTGPSILGFTPGIAGLLTSLMPEPTTEADLGGVYTGFGRGPGAGPQGDGPEREIVPTQTNPVTGEQQCPEGYVFDADIQACRVSAPLANVGETVGETVGGDGFTYEPGTYARMGLLDVAPEDLGGFASTYGTGFMTPEEFEAANLEYRRRAGTQAGIFQDPYNLQGYTLLA